MRKEKNHQNVKETNCFFLVKYTAAVKLAETIFLAPRCCIKALWPIQCHTE